MTLDRIIAAGILLLASPALAGGGDVQAMHSPLSPGTSAAASATARTTTDRRAAVSAEGAHDNRAAVASEGARDNHAASAAHAPAAATAHANGH